MEEKKDWFGLQYANPNATSDDFLLNGIKTNEVELKDKDFYKKNDKIIRAFSDESGKFNEAAFDRFYDNALYSFNKFSNREFEDLKIPDLELDIMSGIRMPGEDVQQVELSIDKKINPFISTIGSSSILGTTESIKTPQEIAQSNKIFDTEKQQWMDTTPEDLGFWGTTFETPIVLARYDEDTIIENPKTGVKTQKFKGELKLDENGLPYYETLGNRNPHNRELLSPFSVITREDSWWNKIDFMDNDGKEKSWVGTIAQTVATIAPMLLPGIGKVYTYGLIAKNFAQLAVTATKMFDGLFNPNAEDSEYGILNLIDGKLQSFNPGVTQESKENIVTFENLGTLVSDIASQLFQQRRLAELPFKLGISKPEKAVERKAYQLLGKEKTEQLLAKVGSKELPDTVLAEMQAALPELQRIANKARLTQSLTGKWLSAGYMSGISTLDVFQDALDSGYDRQTAALTAALAMVATTAMIGKTEIGQKALQGLNFDTERVELRKLGKKLIEEIKSEAKEFTQEAAKDPNKLKNLLKKTGSIYSGLGNIIKGSTYLSTAVAEGLEEMSEEAIMDASKEFTDAITGLFGTQPKGSFKFLESNPLERYLMAGTGGMIGGALFRFGNNFSEVSKQLPKDTKEQIFQALRTGQKDKLINVIKNLEKRGIAPKNLSAIKTKTDADGNIVYEQTDKEDESLNRALGQLTTNLIEEWDGLINQEGLDLTDEDILDRAALKDKRIKSLLNFEGIYKIIKDYNSYGVQITELLQEQKKLNDLIDPKGNREGINIEENTNRLNQVKAKLAELRTLRAEMLEGKKTEEYLKKSLFYLSSFKDKILSTNIDSYTQILLGKSYKSLSPEEKADIDKRYEQYKINFDTKFDEGFKIFDTLNIKYSKDILNLGKKTNVLKALQSYLSGEELALLNLDEEYLKQFDLQRSLNIEKGLAANKGLGYIINNLDLTFENPEVKKIIVDTFAQLEITDSDGNIKNFGVDITPELNVKNIKEFETKFIQELQEHILLTNPKYKEFTDNLDITVNNLRKTGIDESEIAKIIQNNYIEYVTKNVSNNTFKQLLLNMINNASIADSNSFMQDLNKFVEVLNSQYRLDLQAKLRVESAKKLLEDAKTNDDVVLTDDLYKQLLRYIYPQNETNFNAEEVKKELVPVLSDANLTELNWEEWKNSDIELPGLQGVDKTKFYNFLSNLNKYKNWFEVVDDLNELNIPKKYLGGILKSLSIFNKAKTRFLISNYKKLNEFVLSKNKIEANPIYELLKKLSVDVLGNNPINLLTILESENSRLESVNRLSEYTINDATRLDEINSAIDLLDLLSTLIVAANNSTDIGKSGFGYNATLNNFLENHSDFSSLTEPLTVLTPELSFMLLNNINLISKKLKFFKELSERNLGNVLEEHKLTAIRTRQALLKNFTNNSFTSKYPTLFTGVNELIKGYNIEDLNKSDLTKEEFIKLEELVSKIEDTIYENGRKLVEDGNSLENIIEILFSGYDFSSLNPTEYSLSGRLTTNMNELDPRDLYVYYHTILACKSSDFNILLNEIIQERITSNDPKFFIPLYAQEYSARINLAMYLGKEGKKGSNKNLMNHIVQYNDSLLNTIKDERDRHTIEFASSLPNIVYNDGVSGGGKTNGVGYLTKLLIDKVAKKHNESTNIIICGPQSQQSINLVNALTHTDYDENDSLSKIATVEEKKGNVVLTKNDLIEKIYKKIDDLNKANEEFKSDSTSDSKIIQKLEFDNVDYTAISLRPEFLSESNFNLEEFKDIDCIYLDEITQCSKFELQVLSKWAELTGKIIFGYGDSVQSGYSSNNGTYLNITSDILKIATPSLETSLRPTNIHKYTNLQTLRLIATRFVGAELHQKVSIQDLKSLPNFKYYEDDSILHGEKIVQNISLSDLDKFNKGNDLIYIYDTEDSDTYKIIKSYNDSHSNNKIRMFKLEEVQGLESPYAILDLHLNFSSLKFTEKSLKDLYTATTRSRSGSIIINNNLTDYLPDSIKISYTQDTTINADAAKSFASLRLESLANLVKNYESGKVTETSSTSTTTETTETGPTLLTTKSPNSTSIYSDKDVNDLLTEAFNSSEEDVSKLENEEEKNNNKSKIKDKEKDVLLFTYSTRPDNLLIYNDGDVAIHHFIEDNLLYDTDYHQLLGINSKINKDLFNETKKHLSAIKSALYAYTSYDKLKQCIDPHLQELNIKFNDKINVMWGDSRNHLAVRYIKNPEINEYRIKLLFKIYNHKYETTDNVPEYLNIFLADFPKTDNSYYEKPKNAKAKSNYISFINTLNSSITFTPGKISYVDLRVNKNYSIKTITNSVLYKNGKEVSFKDRETVYPGIYFTAPYIVGNSDLVSDLIDEELKTRSEFDTKIGYAEYVNKIKELHSKRDLRGRAVTFASTVEKLFWDNGTEVAKSDYPLYYLKQRHNMSGIDSEGKDKLRMIMLSPQKLTFKELFNIYNDYIKSKDKDRSYFKTYFGDYLGIDIIESLDNLYNWLYTNETNSGFSKESRAKMLKLLTHIRKGLLNLSGKYDKNNKALETEPLSKHIKNIFYRLRTLNPSNVEVSDKIENYNYNGYDVLYYLVILYDTNERILANNDPRYNWITKWIKDNYDTKKVDSAWMQANLGLDKSEDLLNLIELATTGKYLYNNGSEEILVDITKEMGTRTPYYPLFKEGFYTYPIFGKGENQQGGEPFYRANPDETRYNINTDIQPPKLSISLDEINSSEIGFNASYNSTNKSTQTQTKVTITTDDAKLNEEIQNKLFNSLPRFSDTKMLNIYKNKITKDIIEKAKVNFNEALIDLVSSINSELESNPITILTSDNKKRFKGMVIESGEIKPVSEIIEEENLNDIKLLKFYDLSLSLTSEITIGQEEYIRDLNNLLLNIESKSGLDEDGIKLFLSTLTERNLDYTLYNNIKNFEPIIDFIKYVRKNNIIC